MGLARDTVHGLIELLLLPVRLLDPLLRNSGDVVELAVKAAVMPIKLLGAILPPYGRQ